MRNPKADSTITEDLINHPDLAPMLHLAPDGTVVCLGWTSPIYTFNKEFLDDLEKSR